MRDSKTATDSAATPHPKRGKASTVTWTDRLFGKLERAIYPIAFITGVLALVYWYYTTTPQYALAAVVMSVSSHDTQMFEKYVDVDTITGRAFDEVVDGPARKLILGKYDSMIGAGFLRFFKGDIIGIAHEKAVDYVATNDAKINVGAAGWLIAPIASLVPEKQFSFGSAQAASLLPQTSELSSSDDSHGDSLEKGLGGKNTKQQLKDLGISKEGFKGYYFKQDGPIAILGLQFHSPKLNQDWVAEVKFEDAGGYWRVTELANLHDLINRYMAMKESHHA